MTWGGEDSLDLLDQLSEGIVIADEHLAIRYVNPVIERLSGYSPSLLHGRPVTVLVPPDLRAAHLEGFARSRTHGDGPLLSSPPIATRLQHADGTTINIELTLRHLQAPNRYIAVVHALDHHELRTQAVLDAIGEGVYGIDQNGRVLFVNPTAARLTGYSETQQLGRDQHSLIHHHHADRSPRPPADCPILATLRDGNRREIADDTFWTASGTPLPVDYTVAPILDNGEPVGAVVSFRDARQRQTAEQNRLLQATADTQRHVIAELQRAILPEEPAIPGYRTTITYQSTGPHTPLGGDLYDWTTLPDHTIHFCVVDVAGHDVTATKHALTAVYTIRALALAGTPLQEILDRASTQLEASHPELTATATIIHLHPPTGHYQLHSAGHPPPLYLPANGTPTYHHPQGTPLGAPRPPVTPPQHGHLAPGDTLIAYTDGLVEHHGDLAAGMTALLRAATTHPDPARLAHHLTVNATHPDDTLQLRITRQP